ncbi:MAG: hypothetical protein E6I08_05765 [Chloroflexi bacterium]|nr:MAG: hypothetical protein E6I08_05765 [Chloroflexota bacterium]
MSRTPLWARVGGGLELVPGGDRHGPADLDFPPSGEGWEPLQLGGQLVGWAHGSGGRALARQAEEDGARLATERRAHLLGRLGHKMRSAVLSLQESARQAAFGRPELLEQLYEQAQELGRRAAALEAAALDPKDPARGVVFGAILNSACAGAVLEVPADAVVKAPEPVLLEAMARAFEWMGGPGSRIAGEHRGNWWRIEITAAPDARPLAAPELGEPLVQLLVDIHCGGWLDASEPGRAVLWLPAR